MYYQQPQPGMPPVPQYVSASVMAQRLVRERLIFLGIMVIVAIIMFAIGYAVANNIWHQWFQGNCVYYPFLLISSSNHVACTLPTP